MSSLLEALPVILTTLFTGVGAQVLSKIWTRRADLRQINSTSDLNIAQAHEKLVNQLMADGETYRKRVLDLEARVEKTTTEGAEQLAIAHAENSRLSREVARLHTDLDIANGQLAQLRTRYPYAGGI